MKLHYDAATDSLYIDLADRPSVDSEEVADGTDDGGSGRHDEDASRRVSPASVLDSLPSTVETIAAA